MENKNNQQDKKKQLVVVVLIIAVIAVIGFVTSGNDKKREEQPVSTTGISETNYESEVMQTVVTTETATTEPTTQKPTTTKEPETEAPFSEPWRQAYADYVKKAAKEGYNSFNLIYVDNDDVPELFLGSGIEATGERLCTYHNGKIVEQTLYRTYSTSYIENSGLIQNYYGSQGCYGIEIYKLQNGKFEMLHTAYIEEGYSEDYGEFYSGCYLDKKEILREDLDKKIAEYFDANKAKFTYENATDDSESFTYEIMGYSF